MALLRSSRDHTAKLAKIFQQMFTRAPELEPQVRVAARKLRDLGRTVARKTIEDRLFADGVAYSRIEVIQAWKLTEQCWAADDRENRVSSSIETSVVPTIARDANSDDRPGSTATNRSRRPKGAASSWRYDQAYDAGPDHVWIREYTYRTKRGTAVNVRGHWRKRRVPRPKPDTSWKFDINSNTGPGWTWVDGFSTKTYSVRGHWRAAKTCWRKAA